MCVLFRVMGCWPIDPTPNLEDQCISVWVLSFDLSGKGGPTSSYATAGITLWIIAPRKPLYPAKDAFVKVTQNSIEVEAETKESTRKTEEKLDGRYKEGHERKKPK